jgi:hypothetical protein
MPVTSSGLERRFTASVMAATSCSRGTEMVTNRAVGIGITRSRRRDLNRDVAHRDVHDDRIIAEIDFVASAVGATQDGVYRFCLLVLSMRRAGTAPAAHLPYMITAYGEDHVSC